MDLQLKGRTALVTGSSKGIGAAVARAFAAEQCNVVLTARSESLLAGLAAQLRAEYGVTTTAVVADLASADDRRRLLNEHPEIDILINNAGDLPQGTLQAIDDDRWRSSWDVKVFGYINLSRSYYERMCARQSGVIINIVGISGDRVDANYIVGSTGNAALMAFSRALGGVSLRSGVRVVAVNPGPVSTERVQRVLRKRAERELGDADQWTQLTKEMPLGRPATSEEVAATVVFLSSNVSGYTTGTVVTIDGGLSSTIAIA